MKSWAGAAPLKEMGKSMGKSADPGLNHHQHPKKQQRLESTSIFNGLVDFQFFMLFQHISTFNPNLPMNSLVNSRDFLSVKNP